MTASGENGILAGMGKLRAGLLAGFSLAILGCASAPKSPLDRDITPRLVAESGPTELEAVCREIDIPCGWELVPSDASRFAETITNERETGPARRFLDNLVARRPVYRWFLSKDKQVINLAPKVIGANDPLDRPVWVDLDKLTTDAALAKLVESAGLKLVAPPQGTAEVYGEAARPGLVSLKAHGLRLRIALNRLVQADGHSLWWCAQTSDPDAIRCAVPTWRSARAP